MTTKTALAASRPTLGPLAVLVLAVALALAAMLAMPAPAQAHDTLLSTDPEDGSSLETSPEEIAFTFSSDILEVSPLVRVTDETGAELFDIVPTVDGPVATAELPEPLAAGDYAIQWRVVSSDGHPIEGTLNLTIEQDPAGASTSPSDTGGEDAQPTEQATETAETTSTSSEAENGTENGAAAESESDSGLPMPLLLGILAVVVLGAVVAGVVIMRRRD